VRFRVFIFAHHTVFATSCQSPSRRRALACARAGIEISNPLRYNFKAIRLKRTPVFEVHR
jgi:hypothetical protein